MDKQPTGSPRCPSPRSRVGTIPTRHPSATVEHPEPRVTTRYDAPFGRMVLSARGGLLVDVSFATGIGPESSLGAPILEAAVRQLARYFEDPAYRFSLPLPLAGTEYMRRVWSALMQIPPGRTETYGSLACRLASGPRAVALACRANPLPIFVPCHRVVAANGAGGYCGQTGGALLDIKLWLLKHEGCAVD